ncbi:type 4a pilus biogenesis protein PilO [Aquisalimonas asiatica]|uniref:Type IV pilus assembly protein PilO n=1 Tax=Aquisalimonas asiatica TaxID=406100 RepID=A0A1H8TFL7_9GAMM|nr:type 4a pilus biogenesis protein PilO [Aquisalimonas asiatica]SEO89880.1 type IV pilus assembly protein PilO [Aquisalimonas asiatica]
MRLSEINLNELDLNEIGIWPWPAKAVVLILVFALLVGAGWYFDWQDRQDALERAEAEETDLRHRFEVRQERAAALDDYKQQLEEMEESFGAMLRQLPSRVEVAGLLVDISQTGLASGLEFELFRPQETREREFYAEMPIEIEVRGSYHQFGRFVSGVANLPRIVTLHDVEIDDAGGDNGELAMRATARTYWYLDEEDG